MSARAIAVERAVPFGRCHRHATGLSALMGDRTPDQLYIREDIALFGLNPTGKDNVPFTHDSDCAWGRLAPIKISPAPGGALEIQGCDEYIS